MSNIQITFDFERLRCFDEADGLGRAEPYLWTIFFKIDGLTIFINTKNPANPFIQGTPLVVPNFLNHNDLGKPEWDAGDDAALPKTVSEFGTLLHPIKLTPPLNGIASVDGIMGCIAVLLEEDSSSDSDVATSHNALNSLIGTKLSKLLSTVDVSVPEKIQAKFNAMATQIKPVIQSAINESIAGATWLGGLTGDDFIGNAILQFSTSGLKNHILSTGGTDQIFLHRFKNDEGDWEIQSRIKAAIL